MKKILHDNLSYDFNLGFLRLQKDLAIFFLLILPQFYVFSSLFFLVKVKLNFLPYQIIHLLIVLLFFCVYFRRKTPSRH